MLRCGFRLQRRIARFQILKAGEQPFEAQAQGRGTRVATRRVSGATSHPPPRKATGSRSHDAGRSRKITGRACNSVYPSRQTGRAGIQWLGWEGQPCRLEEQRWMAGTTMVRVGGITVRVGGAMPRMAVTMPHTPVAQVGGARRNAAYPQCTSGGWVMQCHVAGLQCRGWLLQCRMPHCTTARWPKHFCIRTLHNRRVGSAFPHNASYNAPYAHYNGAYLVAQLAGPFRIPWTVLPYQ